MARSNPVYTPQPTTGPTAPQPIAGLGSLAPPPAAGLTSPTFASGQVPVTAPTVAYGGAMANSEIARAAPGTPQPGPAQNPSAAPTGIFTPTPSPNQVLDSADRAAVSTAPGYAGPVPVNATSQMQDMAGVGLTRVDGQAAPSDTSQGP